MDSTLHDTSEPDLDTKLLSTLVYEFNISRRYVTAYPENHPIISASAQKVLHLLQQLPESYDEITIGIAKDSLLIGESFLDRNNLVFRDFARLLFGHGIAAMTLQKQLSWEELYRVNIIHSLRREHVRDRGGIKNILADAGIRHLQKQHIVDIVQIQVSDLIKRMDSMSITLELTKQAKELLAEKGYDPAFGERPLRRAIQATLRIRSLRRFSKASSPSGP